MIFSPLTWPVSAQWNNDFKKMSVNRNGTILDIIWVVQNSVCIIRFRVDLKHLKCIFILGRIKRSKCHRFSVKDILCKFGWKAGLEIKGAAYRATHRLKARWRASKGTYKVQLGGKGSLGWPAEVYCPPSRVWSTYSDTTWDPCTTWRLREGQRKQAWCQETERR